MSSQSICRRRIDLLLEVVWKKWKETTKDLEKTARTIKPSEFNVKKRSSKTIFQLSRCPKMRTSFTFFFHKHGLRNPQILITKLLQCPFTVKGDTVCSYCPLVDKLLTSLRVNPWMKTSELQLTNLSNVWVMILGLYPFKLKKKNIHKKLNINNYIADGTL